MQILIYHRRRTAPQLEELRFPYISLYQDNWDDFGWKCRFVATLHLTEDEELDLGPLRIASDDKGFRAAELPALLKVLPARSVSMGESIAYYRRLRSLKAKVRRQYLSLMRDLVAKPERRERIKNESLWDKCFMREASSRHALKRGGYYIGAAFEEVEPPSFVFEMTLPNASGPHAMGLDFSQYNGLPNRTILLIGRNGTGKTTALATLAAGLMPPQVFNRATLDRLPGAHVSPDVEISRLIAISYNVFDEFPLPRPASEKSPRIDGVAYRSRGSYKYCGLRDNSGVITANEVSQMLDEALEPVVLGDRMDILRRVLSTLLNPSIATSLTSEENEERAAAIAGLSAGQRLVVAIFSNIVGFIEEGSLLLIDEPETNLHPGLLSSFVAALNETLVEFDSYAIVASHSPILLQQVPGRFVRHFTRDISDRPKIKALEIESFGEDLGELTRRVLGLADPERDFTDVLKKLFDDYGSAGAVEALFDYPLGVPATAYLYALEELGRSETDL
ncbi:UNVERIFIED_ORG: energy-coupling factor transporter ATP-binding protein EcfA2 [Rhizobium esperanzae]